MSEIVSDKVSKRFGDDYIKEIVKALRAAGKDGSGRLIKSLDYRLKDTANQVNILIEGEDYLTYVDEGRKRGSFPPLKELSKWARLKGIKQEAVFPIAKNIYKFGIKPTNVIDKATNKVLNGNSFNEFEKGIANDIENRIFNNIQEEVKKK